MTIGESGIELPERRMQQFCDRFGVERLSLFGSVLREDFGSDSDTFEQYGQDLMLRSAVERQIEIIGGAARGISGTFKTAHPEIRWRPITAQRHRLAHEYGQIDDSLIWKVATVHVPEMILQIEPLCPPAM